MVAKEYCCYTRPYSNIEGYQRAYTLCYYASLEEEGVVLAVQRQQGGECTTEQVICPTGDFGRLMPLMRYLCENGVGLGHWTRSAGRRRGDLLALYGSRGQVGKAESRRDL